MKGRVKLALGSDLTADGVAIGDLGDTNDGRWLRVDKAGGRWTDRVSIDRMSLETRRRILRHLVVPVLMTLKRREVTEDGRRRRKGWCCV